MLWVSCAFRQFSSLRASSCDDTSERNDAARIPAPSRWRLADTEAAYEEALKIDAIHAPAIHHLGLIALQRGIPAEGVRLITKALEIDPTSAVMHVHLGKGFYSLEQLEHALSSLSRAIEIRPDFAEAYCDRGIVLCDLDRRAEALDDYDKAISIKDGFAEAYWSN